MVGALMFAVRITGKVWSEPSVLHDDELDDNNGYDDDPTRWVPNCDDVKAQPK